VPGNAYALIEKGDGSAGIVAGLVEFDVVHGQRAYAKFIAELDLCTDRTKTYDVLSELVKE
jgi:hypothetical protein